MSVMAQSSNGKKKRNRIAEPTDGNRDVVSEPIAEPIAEPEPPLIPSGETLARLDTADLGKLAGSEYAAGEYVRTVHWLRAGAYASEYVSRWVGKGYNRADATRDMESAIRMASGCKVDIHTLLQAHACYALLANGNDVRQLPWSGFKALMPLVTRDVKAEKAERWAIHEKAGKDAALSLFSEWANPTDGQRMPVDTLTDRVNAILGRVKPETEEAKRPETETEPQEVAVQARKDATADMEDDSDEEEEIASLIPSVSAPSEEEKTPRDWRAGMVASIRAAANPKDAATMIGETLARLDEADSVMSELVASWDWSPDLATETVSAILRNVGPETRNAILQKIAGSVRKAG